MHLVESGPALDAAPASAAKAVLGQYESCVQPLQQSSTSAPGQTGVELQHEAQAEGMTSSEAQGLRLAHLSASAASQVQVVLRTPPPVRFYIGIN